MAITKKFVIHQRLDDRVCYVLNDDKTSLDDMLEYTTNDDKTVTLKKEYKTALNCNLEKAHQDMMATKKRRNAMGGRLGYHIIQSFAPGEVTAEEAHMIAIELAQRSFGDYEVVIGTHIDKAHIHSHIVVNSVSVITGKKYRDTAADLFDGIRGVSDQICREHGLSIVVPNKERKTLTYIEWLARKGQRVTRQSLIRMDIDDCINQAYDFGNFLVLMRLKGYEIKQGKHISFCPFGKDRFSRGYTLGHEYSLENIQRRIVGLRSTTEFKDMQSYINQKYDFKPFPKVKKGSFRALCLHYMYLLGQVKHNKAPDRVSNLIKEDLIRFEAMMKTINFTKLRHLDTVESVERYKDKCYETIALIKREQTQVKNDPLFRLFDAVVDRSRYAKAHSLYRDEGFVGMKAEHDKYVAAVRILQKAGYKTDAQIQDLIDRQSEVESKLAQITSDIRYFRHEIKMCDQALQFNQYVRGKKEEIDKVESVERNSLDGHQR